MTFTNECISIKQSGECVGNVAQMALEPSTDFLTDVGRTQVCMQRQTHIRKLSPNEIRMSNQKFPFCFLRRLHFSVNV